MVELCDIEQRSQIFSVARALLTDGRQQPSSRTSFPKHEIPIQMLGILYSFMAKYIGAERRMQEPVINLACVTLLERGKQLFGQRPRRGRILAGDQAAINDYMRYASWRPTSIQAPSAHNASSSS